MEAEERRDLHTSSPEPMDSLDFEALPDESSRVPPSLPSPDLGPVLTPIDVDDPPVFDIRRASSLEPRSHAASGYSVPFTSSPPSGPARHPGPSQPTIRHETRAHDAQSTTRPTLRQATTFSDINPNDYRPGRFRSTIQQLAQMEQARNAPPPSLPPLGFERAWEPEQARPSGAQSTNYDPTGLREQRPQPHPRPERDDSYGWRFPGLNPDRGQDSGVPTWQPFLGHRHPQPIPTFPPELSTHTEPSPSSTTRPTHHSRSSSDVHEFLSNRPRIEGSRLVMPEHPSSQSTRTPGEEEGLSVALSILRRDGLSSTRSQQIMDQFQDRERRSNMDGTMSSSTSTAHDAARRASEARNLPGSSFGRRNRGYPRREFFATIDADSSHSETPSSSSSNPRVPPSRDPTSPAHLRLRNIRARLLPSSMGSMFNPTSYADRSRTRRPMGDYMRDDDFSPSYEFLLQLGESLGDAKPKSTPDHVLASLPTGIYKDWATADSDQRCPICLDDYQSLDPVLKLPECSHWLHKECLEQWLRGANTCPVCRNSVKSSAPRSRRGDSSSSSDARHAPRAAGSDLVVGNTSFIFF
ncbi:hypothetical protein ONZ45_g16030 [Pleurotus djamor]|nr:hypothetical protein ONZ45_g16030 [Pleurotus djamor]